MAAERSTDASPARPVAGDGLLHPVPLAAIGLLLLNDHVLKAAFPGLVTGKLSDFAGLAFFPLFLQAGWESLSGLRGRWSGPSRRALLLCTLATALVFALVKLWHPAGEAYRWGLALLQWPFRSLVALLAGGALPPLSPVSLVRDPSDLVALPSVLLPLLLVRPWRSAPVGASLGTARERH